MPSRAVQNLKAAVAKTDFFDEADTTQPLEQRTTGAAVVKAAGRGPRDIAYGDLIEIVHHAELQVFEGKTGVELQAELDNARRQMNSREHVDPAVIRKLHKLTSSWLVQRDLDGDES